MQTLKKQDGKSRFHIHFDGKFISPELEKWAMEEKGFWWDNFLPREASYMFTPDRHLTLKPKTGREFKMLCEEIYAYLRSNPDRLVGYLECEHIKNRHVIPWKEFDPSIKFPFSIETGSLAPGAFRESEIHVSLSQDSSDPRLMARFREAGFFVAFTKREHGTNAVFTTQGYRKDMEKVWSMLVDYLEKAGGGMYCHMKEERITKFWLSSPEYPLPPVVSKIRT